MWCLDKDDLRLLLLLLLLWLNLHVLGLRLICGRHFLVLRVQGHRLAGIGMIVISVPHGLIRLLQWWLMLKMCLLTMFRLVRLLHDG